MTWSPNHSGHPQVQAVDRLFSELASRIGSVPEGADEPARLRRQRWSSVNVPLMWEPPPVLESLMGMASRLREPIQFQENWLQATHKHCGQVGSLSEQCSGVGALLTANISPVGWESMDFQRHSQGTTSPPGHKRHFSTRLSF